MRYQPYETFEQVEDDVLDCMDDGMTPSETSAHLNVSVVDVIAIYARENEKE